MKQGFFKSAKVSQIIRFVLDELIPPFIRDRKWFYVPIIRLFNKKLDINFKKIAPFLSDDEFINVYEQLPLVRETDMTSDIQRFIINSLSGESILEIGSGNGDMAVLCASQNKKVVATDVTEKSLKTIEGKIGNLNIQLKKANVEKLPFEDRSFDTVICIYTLEHVRNLYMAVNEIKRVAQKRIIIIVPRQRYFRYTCDYHINYFYGEEQLTLLFSIKDSRSYIIDNSICYLADIK